MLICGIDEAGRGPLAGPVVAAAVIIESCLNLNGVRDSKKMTERQRENLFEPIIENCLDYSIQSVDNAYIDNYNILKAVMLAMENCINNLKVKPDIYLIDGNYFKLINNNQNKINFETVVKGDDSVFQISCASVLAKVTRDRIMVKYDKKYPQYGFKQNKGYGTSMHIDSIKKYGLCEIHRKSFLKNII